MNRMTLEQARFHLECWRQKVVRLEKERCATVGHVKGGGAWKGVFYCKTCQAQVLEEEFPQGGEA